MEEEINSKRINEKVNKSYFVEIFQRMGLTFYQRFTKIVKGGHE